MSLTLSFGEIADAFGQFGGGLGKIAGTAGSGGDGRVRAFLFLGHCATQTRCRRGSGDGARNSRCGVDPLYKSAPVARNRPTNSLIPLSSDMSDQFLRSHRC